MKEEFEKEGSPEDVFRQTLRRPFGELEGEPLPLPKDAIIISKELSEDEKRRHRDHLMAAHHKFMSNHYRKKGHKQ